MSVWHSLPVVILTLSDTQVILIHCRVGAEQFIDERTLCRIPWAYARFYEYNAALFRAFAAVAVTSISLREMRSPQVSSCLATSLLRCCSTCSKLASASACLGSWLLAPGGFKT